MKAVDELLAEFPAIPNQQNYIKPEDYLEDCMTVAKWFMDHAEDIRQALSGAAIEWIGSAEALNVARDCGVEVTKVALWKAAVDRGYVDYKTILGGRHLYNRSSVEKWASTRKYHKSGPRSEYGEMDDTATK